MKKSMLTILIGGFVFGSVLNANGQVKLPEIEVTAVNYKYLSSTTKEEVSEPVRTIRYEAAAYDVKESPFYEDEYDYYHISFFIPEGKILASYDKEGNLLRTAEKFSNVQLPKAVERAVAKRFPNWTISKDVYLVTYNDAKGTNKRYKLLLENDDKRMKVRIDEKGNFM
ncbi:nicotinate-nucleotide adenylyltransferase [Negadavirga shengliensis]|uniref:Nicotinate-nucleotide adenylyltransferase n=1 Tax=Negadavirga shengliensis TaxID=1389218 RepID=A0ABV9T751_9BACT